MQPEDHKWRRVRVIISGRVQGVYFRHFTKVKASELGVRGWVKNLDDGRVEAVFEGDPGSVRAMVDWCHHGPPTARVDSVEITFEDYRGDFTGFRVI